MTPVPGKTYALRAVLFRMGGEWDDINKIWSVPDDKIAAAIQIVEEYNAPNNVAAQMNRDLRYVKKACQDMEIEIGRGYLCDEDAFQKLYVRLDRVRHAMPAVQQYLDHRDQLAGPSVNGFGGAY